MPTDRPMYVARRYQSPGLPTNYVDVTRVLDGFTFDVIDGGRHATVKISGVDLDDLRDWLDQP